MAQDIKLFSNPNFGEIRTAGTSEEPLFCLSDLCHAIGIKDVSKCASRLDGDVRLTHPLLTKGGTQQATFVTEAGMYDVIIRSDSDRAKPFRKWITSEVLPTIRKTGGYSVKTEVNKQPTISDKMKVATWLIKTLNLNGTSKLMLAKSIADPLGLPTPDYTPSKGVVKSATELLKETGLSISAQAFNQRAIQKGILCDIKRKSSKGKDKHFKSITESGRSYGENQVNPNNPKETQPLWYKEKFNELLMLLDFKLARVL